MTVTPIITKEMCEEKHGHLAERLNEIEGKIDDVLRILNGNGKLGLAGKITILWNCSLFVLITLFTTAIKVWLF
jgi:hypothetical protein